MAIVKVFCLCYMLKQTDKICYLWLFHHFNLGMQYCDGVLLAKVMYIIII